MKTFEIKYVGVALSVLFPTIVLYLLWYFLRVCFFDYFTIPTESMNPTLQIGDKVVVNKMLFGGRIYKELHFEEAGQVLDSWRLNGLRYVQHNDICVFNFPKHNNHISFVINHCFCKRCVGLPGDSLWVEDGFYRNNNYHDVLGLADTQEELRLLPDSILPHPRLIDKVFGWTLKDFGPIYLPRKGDTVLLTPQNAIVYRHLLEWELGKKIEWNLTKSLVFANGEQIQSHCFQHDYYFMAGDNVLCSNDSRYWGLVPEEYIIGIVGWIIKK